MHQLTFTLLEQCTHITVVSRPNVDIATEKALNYMVECCDFVIAVYNSHRDKESVTDWAMEGLRKSIKPYLQIEPDTLELRQFGVKNE